jgi:hypothetical protein
MWLADHLGGECSRSKADTIELSTERASEILEVLTDYGMASNDNPARAFLESTGGVLGGAIRHRERWLATKNTETSAEVADVAGPEPTPEAPAADQ